MTDFRGGWREPVGYIEASTAISMEVDAQGRTWIEALVVNESTIKKITCQPPVLRGFSIIAGNVPPGGRDPKDPSTITAATLREVSIIDRPAQAEAVITMWKLDDDPPRVSPDMRARPDAIAKVERERDDAIAKAAALRVDLRKAERERDRAVAERDRLAKAARGQAAAVARIEAERDRRFAAAQRKGATRALPAGVAVVEKAQDNGSTETPDPEPDDPRSLIRKAQRAPAALFDPPRARR